MARNLYTASKQWAKRPDDERFLTLDDLAAFVKGRKLRSFTRSVALEHLDVTTNEEGNELMLGVPAVNGADAQLARFNHWAFNQAATRAKAPAKYLRTLPAPIAAMNLAWGMETSSDDGRVLIEQATGDEGNGEGNGSDSPLIRAFTSDTYGRIWDAQVVESIQRVADPDVWKIPSASYATTDPKRATTLYASDRDVFIFLVNEENAIEVDGETLFRGFFCWNSEVGSATFGLTTFLYDRVCDNRIVWGAREVKELRIRHTSGGPMRFVMEAPPTLRRYLDSSTREIEQTVKKAKDVVVGKTDKEVMSWLKKKKFTENLAKVALERARERPGNPHSVWNLVAGLTDKAKDYAHCDKRVKVEADAGKLMQDLAA